MNSSGHFNLIFKVLPAANEKLRILVGPEYALNPDQAEAKEGDTKEVIIQNKKAA